ncbi:MAG: ATP-binding protein [Pseudomonadota bacterium]
MSRFNSVYNSILARVFALTFGTVVLTLITLASLAQSPLANGIYERALVVNSRSLADLVWLIETSPDEAEQTILSNYQGRARYVRITDSFTQNVTADPAKKVLLTSEEAPVVQRIRDREVRFQVLGLFELRQAVIEGLVPRNSGASAIHIAIVLDDGRVLNVWLWPGNFMAQGEGFLIVVLGLVLGFTLVLGIALYWVIMRPIRELERVAEHVGLAQTSVPVPETGPRELRRLSAALNRMRERLGGLIREREQIMVAIAHDIRTGLTKLRLRLDADDTPADPNIDRDLTQMERLITDMLAYARAENPVIEPELIELRAFVAELAKAAPIPITIIQDDEGDAFVIAGNSLAIGRLFENLLENARRYGRGSIWLTISHTPQGLAITIEDDGPGIPPDDLDHVFEPFYRGEGSRNRSTGGTGLGLGIARAIAHSHGAQISLANRDEGGLCVCVSFPEALRT